MKVSARSILMAGATTLTATAVAAAPSVQPPPPQKPNVALAAAVQSLADPPAPHLLQVLVTNPGQLLGPSVPVGSLPPAPAPTAIAIAPNLANTIDNVYLAVEPWVQYGFEVATYALGWVPVVGWLSGQIMVFYTFGEGIVASGVFNVTDWMRGDGGVIDNVVDFGIDVGLAFAWLGIDEWNYFLPPLPPLPLPPRPPYEGRPGPNFLSLLGLVPGQQVGAPTAGDALDVAAVPPLVRDLLAGLRNIAAPSTTVERNAASDTQLATDEVGPLPIANAVARLTDTVSGFVAPGITQSEPDAEKLDARAADSVGNEVVRGPGAVQGALTKAATDVANALGSNKPGKAAQSGFSASANPAKSLGDAATNVVNKVREAAKDARQTTKEKAASDTDG